ncbi:MAG TPA: sialidase family protein [Thermoanaerobaculia bacterium]|nr:sialidase family protein [Thermoanaerobaculia bacterium]
MTVSLGVNVGVVPAVGPGGVLHLVWTRYFLQERPLRALMLTSRSDDGGASWSEPVQIADNFAVGVRGMRVGDGLGTLALDPRNGALYAAWEDSRYSPADPPLDQIVLSRSTDGGATWTPPQRVSDGPPDAASFTPAVAVDASSRVGVAYYSLRNDPERRFRVDEYFALSRNSGLTFTASVRVSPASWDATLAAVSRGYQGPAAGKRNFYPLFVATLARSRIDGSRPQPDVYTASLR